MTAIYFKSGDHVPEYILKLQPGSAPVKSITFVQDAEAEFINGTWRVWPLKNRGYASQVFMIDEFPDQRPKLEGGPTCVHPFPRTHTNEKHLYPMQISFPAMVPEVGGFSDAAQRQDKSIGAASLISDLIDEMKRYLCNSSDAERNRLDCCLNLRNSCCRPGLRDAIIQAQEWLAENDAGGNKNAN